MSCLESAYSKFVAIACFVVLTCQLAAAEPKAPSGTGVAASIPALAIQHGPFLQAPSQTGVTISWATTRKAVSWVEYRLVSSSEWVTNVPSQHGLVNADVTRHNVPLTGLKPGTSYIYRAISREIRRYRAYSVKFGETITSQEYRFTTLDARKPAFSFVVVNDRHENVAPLKASLASVDWNHVDLAFLNGDMVNAAQDEEQLYRVVVDPCTESFAQRIPLVYVRGNHETRGHFARELLESFPTDSGRYYYTFQHGSVMFLVLDCGEDKADENEEYFGLTAFRPYMETQRRWLENEIESVAFKQAAFRVCLLHIPPSSQPNAKFVQPHWLWKNFVPLLNKGKVDLLICGHTHRDAVRVAGTDGLTFPLIIGGAETVIRCDVTADEIRTTNSNLAGTPLPMLSPIKARAQ